MKVSGLINLETVRVVSALPNPGPEKSVGMCPAGELQNPLSAGFILLA